MPTVTVNKGSRVHAQVFKVNPMTCLSGAQMKVGATCRNIVGTVTHVWGDHPTAPTKYEIAIKPDGEDEEVVVPSSAIVAVDEPF
jgi:hypothetical protein